MGSARTWWFTRLNPATRSLPGSSPHLAFLPRVPQTPVVSGRRARGQDTRRNLPIWISGQHRGVDEFTVDIGAVKAVDVDDLDCLFRRRNFGMVLADGGVVEDDVVVGMPSGGCDGPIFSRYRDPALGPRFTTSRAESLGSPSSTLRSMLLTVRPTWLSCRLGEVLQVL